MFSEDDLLPISGLQHLAFCPRQCALIHVEGAWAENRLSAEGRLFHERVHDGPDGLESGRVVVRGMRLASRRLGLSGVADVVEFVPCDDGVELDGRPGRWRPIPVEYKRGRPKKGNEDRVQLCAQALCLEEHFGLGVFEGALFYGRTRRRQVVELSDLLRRETEAAANAFRELVTSGTTPAAETRARCRRCSLRDVCMPDARKRAGLYVQQMIRAAQQEDEAS
jgi:CRISPR-associated exonuclease Cas4